MTKLTPDELNRYSRHLVLDEFGIDGQTRLKNGSVIVVGAGGLGTPALLYLTAAGVGTIGIADDDVIELSNLQRQVLYGLNDVGKSKAATAAMKLQEQNPNITFNVYSDRINSKNALQILDEYDVVIDGTDNFPSRYLLNDACVILGKPLVYGSILKFEGQLSIFNLKKADGTYSNNYRDLFPEPPSPDTIQNCEQAGVIGVLPGVIGTLQATEAIKIVSQIGEPIHDKLLIFDALTLEQNIISTPNRNTATMIKSLIDYDDFCGISQKKNKSLAEIQSITMKEVTVQELKKLKESGADFQLIDVREPHEYDICNLDGELIPMSEIPHNVDKISKSKQVIIHCRSGKRSGDMLLWLEKNHGFDNLYNLKGGVLAWAKEIDPSMPQY
jgi:sulfur-carrier protein adenylyltransferase/sulfurtransferase